MSNIIESAWQKLVIIETLTNVILTKETAQEQVDSSYHRLKHWCNVVFDEGRVSPAIVFSAKILPFSI